MDHLENTTMHQKYKHLSLEDRVIIQIRLRMVGPFPELQKLTVAVPILFGMR